MLSKKAKWAIVKGVITKRSPIYVQYALTKRCDLDCEMCGASSARAGEKELGIDEIERLADVLAQLGAGIIILTGGEPFLRDDLVDVVRIFSARGFEVRLQTKGLLATGEKIRELCAAGLGGLTLSLDSLDPQKQDRINNCKGSWHRIIKALALFSNMLPQKGGMTGVNTVVSRLNIAEIPDVVRFVTEIGFYSSLIPVHLSSGCETGFIVRKDTPSLQFCSEDSGLIDGTYRVLRQMKRDGYNIYNSFRFLDESPDFLKYKIVHWRCDSPNLYFSISPGGDFLPCVDMDMDMRVSMLDNNFVSTYRSSSFRRMIEENVRRCPGCLYACYPEISYLCRQPKVFMERIFQGLRISRSIRRPMSHENLVKLIDRIRRRTRPGD